VNFGYAAGVRALHRKVLDILEKKPVQTVVFFGLLALTARFLAAPWWEGPVLTVRPTLPDPSGAFVKAPEEDEEVRQELATVELDDAAEATAEPSMPRTPMSHPPGAADANVKPSAERDRSRRLPSLGDLQLLETIQKLDEKLDAPPTELHRPCLEWSPSYVASGYAPLCRRRAMDGFFDQLRDVALDQSDRPVRISQLGDSLVAGDAFTGELRRLLHEQFGDGGFGFVHIGEASPHVGTRNLTSDTSSAWTVHDVVWEPHSDFKFGIAGVSFLAKGRPSLGIYPHDSGHGRSFDRVGLLYYRRESESSVRVTIDGDDRDLDLSGPAERNAVRWLDIEPGPHELRLSGFDRSNFVYGVLLEKTGPGVVIDNLGISSGRAPRLRFVGEDQWQAQIRKRNPDVMSFAFGVNSAGKHKAPDNWLEEYRDHYARILATARAAREELGCMVISVLTRGARENGRVDIYDSVKPLVRYQRDAARRANCAFWNAFGAMGGAEGARRWFDNHPQLLGSDLAHPTRAGYKKLANLFYTSLIRQFRRYLDERIRRSTVPTPEDDDASGDNRQSTRTPLETGGGDD